nr:hypothetical protein [Leptolyngbyaceae cyanobacterium MO_188.B28]
PTVGFLFTALSTNFSMPIFWRVIDFILAATAYIVCLPYTIFVIFSITQSELVSLSKLLVRKLIIITSIIGILGYFVGSQNHLFLTCDDFKVSGSDLPANCRQVKGSPLKSETKTGEPFLSEPSRP